jgi:hypothetical protein
MEYEDFAEDAYMKPPRGCFPFGGTPINIKPAIKPFSDIT